MAQYVGILDGSKDVWGVRISDVPGCHGGGATPEAAIADAISALREFAAHQQTKGIARTPPRTVQEVIHDKASEFDPKAGEVLVMIPLILDQARPVKANISLDAGLLEVIDEEAARRGLTRSAFLTSAALDKIQLTITNALTVGGTYTLKAGSGGDVQTGVVVICTNTQAGVTGSGKSDTSTWASVPGAIPTLKQDEKTRPKRPRARTAERRRQHK